MDKGRSRQLTFCIAILIVSFSIPCLTSAFEFDVRHNFPEHIQGNSGIYLQYRNGSNYVDLINNNPFGGGGLSNDYVFVNPDLTDPDHFPVILAYEYNNPVPSLNQISAAPSCTPRNNINADAVIRINLPDTGGQVQITGSCGKSSSEDVYFTIYKGAGNYSSPVWSTWNSGTIDVTIPYSKGEQLFFATNSGTSCGANLPYWKDLKLIITPVAAFSGMPKTGQAPLTVAFTDQSTGSPTGWAWYFGDEDYTASWTEMNGSSGWSARRGHTSVAMPDGSIVLMGGFSGGGYVSYNDTWRSTDNGGTWMLMNASSGWSERFIHTSMAMPDGSIVLMGGCYPDGPCYNDTWRSVDSGSTWILINASAGWSPRGGHTSVVMPDGSIVLMGGWSIGPDFNDVWRSFDNGTTWTLVNASAGWFPRGGHTSVVMPDSSIVLMGGIGPLNNETWTSIDNGATWTKMNSSSGWSMRYRHTSVTMPDGSIILLGGLGNEGFAILKNDTWRSTDNGKTWDLINESSGWSARWDHTSVAMPDGSIVLFGGGMNDTWRFQPVGSSAQNPSHTYTMPGIYNVALQAYNFGGYNSTRKAGYITATNVTSKIGIFRPTSGICSLDTNGNYVWEVSDKSLSWGLPNDTPVIGDWNGDGKDGIGIFRSSSGIWSLDSNENFAWEGSDVSLSWGLPGDIPVIGDWNGDNKDDIGIFRPSSGVWSLDSNGNFAWEVSDTSLFWGWPGDIPVMGDWNGDGKDEIGIFRPNYLLASSSMFSLDSNGNFVWELSDTSVNWGLPNDVPVLGDWNGNGTTKIGIFRPTSGIWSLDSNGNYIWEVSDKSSSWGLANDQPVIGDWNGDGKDDIGIFRPSNGIWSLDSNGNFAWEGSDMSLFWGLPNDKTGVGKY